MNFEDIQRQTGRNERFILDNEDLLKYEINEMKDREINLLDKLMIGYDEEHII